MHFDILKIGLVDEAAVYINIITKQEYLYEY
jgi:hypothetical protein